MGGNGGSTEDYRGILRGDGIRVSSPGIFSLSLGFDGGDDEGDG